MAETSNIADVALKISKDIFKYFKWHTHPKKDDNFNCLNDGHMSERGKCKSTHPTDVVFSYQDPYSTFRVHLLTDLKSYSSDSITQSKLRSALKSLAMSVECANQSGEWKSKFNVVTEEHHEVRGLLFVHNHDKGYEKNFYLELGKVKTKSLPIARSNLIHYLGPSDIQRLFTIANDLMRLKSEDELPGPENYTFYYPDLVMKRRSLDVWDQAATIETIAGPYIIIKHRKAEKTDAGFIIYYNRDGDCPEEFEYLIDSFSRFQMLESGERIRVRLVSANANSDFKSHFETAKRRYVKSWGFLEERKNILDGIEVDRVAAVSDNYDPGQSGWKT